jgi:hypothetical protein
MVKTTSTTTSTTQIATNPSVVRTPTITFKQDQTSVSMQQTTTTGEGKRRTSVTSKKSNDSTATQTESEKANELAADAIGVAVSNLQAIVTAIGSPSGRAAAAHSSTNNDGYQYDEDTMRLIANNKTLNHPSIIRRSASDNKRELLLSSDSIMTRQEFQAEMAAIGEDTDYYDYVIKPRHVKNRNCLKSSSAMELKATNSTTGKSVHIDEQQQREYAHRFNEDFNNHEIFEEEVELDNEDKTSSSSEHLTNKPIERSASKQSGDALDGNFSDNTIKTVVDKCFNQIAKNKKIKSPCIYVKHNHNKPSSASSPPLDQDNKTNSTSSKSQIKLININPAAAAIHPVDENNNERSPTKNSALPKNTSPKLPNASSISSMCSSETMSSIDNPNLKQTVVEKAADILNAPTNTLLLSGGNDVNELYSLKITFV